MNDYVLDARLGFSVRQGFGRVRGSFDTVEGSLTVEADDPSTASVELTFRADSIQTRNKRRDDHLRRSFLAAAEHPLGTFVSTEVTRVDDSVFRVTGVLTIRGVAKPMSFDLKQSEELRFEGELTLDRRDWRVVWNALAEGWGLFVAYDVRVRLDVTVTRRVSGPVAAGFEAEAQ
ncbi:YceI family protein [Kribbella lupini]|uniref:YceI family protein n=1 Tax=Kribbella lupini TaxID=291602 RepID=A0ABN2AD02_9ACTN